eukprot:CAMPEP_0115162424 /NCGR_PEP_ID=MMETSP0227-20121206/71953_1 /TAXON_ID=89957 /ORGANISM="Polarella glacialis, Strain CCMP 1383" /LENGTH=70 /DNA_ID=CAMNT_0002574631 /DNA_START=50 /DNA_END=262 /DNA_ORIENTATION=-
MASREPKKMPKTRKKDIMAPADSCSSWESPRCDGPSIMESVDTYPLEKANATISPYCSTACSAQTWSECR